MMKLLLAGILCLFSLTLTIDCFQIHSTLASTRLQRKPCLSAQTTSTTTTSIHLAKNENDMNNEFMRWARASRTASATDNVVELMKPLGLVLNQDDYGNVYVETLAPKGNAARSGQVKEGDVVTMCSATFGDEMWSTRGVGLTRVLAAIRVRSGNKVRLVFESPKQAAKKLQSTTQEIAARQQAAAAAQAKKDQLLRELEQTEQKLKGNKFFGLF
jgi:C-terminal processing protease CtpA/Prc